LKCRERLLKNDIGTKILPEAINWHFAGNWEHIKEIKNQRRGLMSSKKLLQRCVSIPIFLKNGYSTTNKIAKILNLELL